jgi:rod shape-determining protein MreD
MTLSFGTFARVGVLLLAGLLLQLTAISQVTILGTNIDLAPLIVVSVGLLAGPVAGSVVGFLAGVLIDLSLVQTLGVTSLLLITIGYLAGRYRELRDTSHGLLPLAGGAIATLAYAAGLALTQFLLGVESSVSGLVVRNALAQVAVNALVALAVFPAVRALLRPSLVDPWRPRKRRAATGLRVPLAP